MRLGETSPTREEFAALDRPVVPVVRRLLADGLTAVGVYRTLAGNRPGTVLLESAEQGRQWARYSFVGVRSAGVLAERGGVTEWLGQHVPGLTDDLPADPLAAVVQQHDSGEVLMVAWMDDEALHRTLTTGRATYWSRSRQEYWVKGDTSGSQQWVKSVALDCDGDSLLVRVDQVGSGACHTGDRTCFDATVLHAVVGTP